MAVRTVDLSRALVADLARGQLSAGDGASRVVALPVEGLTALLGMSPVAPSKLAEILGPAVLAEVRAALGDDADPTPEAEAGWLATLEASNRGRSRFTADCTPGYYNNEGRPDDGPGWFGGNYGGGAPAFFRLLRDWRERDDLEGLAVR